jgi:hypothetical protein
MYPKSRKISLNAVRQVFYAACIACVSCFVSCGDKDNGDGGQEYNPSKPVVLTSYEPDSGRIAEKVILRGENFGSDPTKIKVYFNSKQAAVVGADGKQIYALCPRLPGDTCDISVVIGKDSLVYDHQFRYRTAASVSTLVGNGTQAFRDGPLSQALIRNHGLCIDADGNLFATLYIASPYITGMVRISEEEDMVYTLITNFSLQFPAVDRRTGIIYIQSDERAGQYYVFNPKDGWAMKTRQWTWKPGNTVVAGSARHSCDICYPHDALYSLHSDGNLVKIDIPTNEAEVVTTIPFVGNIWGAAFHPIRQTELYWAYNGVNMQGTQHRYSIFMVDVADPTFEVHKLNYNAPASGGFRDGDLATAEFKDIGQLFFDPDGNLYLADRGNHCIRRITTDNKVETVVGIPGQSGFKDGYKEDALFNDPYSLTVGTDGTVYVGDFNNCRIRKLTIE